MSYVNGEWYHGPITEAVLFEANSGSVGISVTIDGPHGPVEGALWLTDAGYQKTIAKLEKWGLRPEDYMNPEFSASPGQWLAGKQASFTAEISVVRADDGTEKTIVKAGVVGAGGGRRQADPATISKAQGIFQRKAAAKVEAQSGFDAPWPDEAPF